MRRMGVGRHASAPRIVALLVLLAVAAALRFWRLDFQSLWIDELFSVVFSRSELGLDEIAAAYARDVHPPAYPFALHGWLTVFGDTDLAARALSACFGVLGVAAMLAVGRWCFDARTGWIAASLTAVNAFHIAYSQEARAYSLLFLAAAASYGGFLAVALRPTWRRTALYAAATAAAIHAHYYGFVMVSGQLAAALLFLGLRRPNRGAVGRLLVGAAAAALTMLPWLGPMLRVAGLSEFWAARPAPGFAFEYFHEYFGRSLPLSLVAAFLLLALPVLLRAAPADAGIEGRLRAATAAGLLAASVTISLLAAYLRSVLVVPMLVPKLTIAFLPALLLLLALAITRLRPAPLRWAIVSGFVVLSAAQLVRSGYYTEPRKEQWREAVQTVLADPRFVPGLDLCVGLPAAGFQFYFDQLGAPVIVEEPDPERLAEIVRGRVLRPTVWLLVARDEAEAGETRAFLRRRWRRAARTTFIATSVERWEPLESKPSQRSNVERSNIRSPTE